MTPHPRSKSTVSDRFVTVPTYKDDSAGRARPSAQCQIPFEVENLTDCGNAEARSRRCMLSSGTS